MIDTHCHLDVPAFADDIDAVVARATAAGVIGMLIPAIRPHGWSSLAALAAQHRAAGVRFAIGIHPQIVPELAPDEIEGRAVQKPGTGPGCLDIDSDATTRDGLDIDAIADWIARAAITHGAIAIGECGLDGGTPDLPRQEALFRAHIRAARATGLPLVIHVLRAHDLAPRILREELRSARIGTATIDPPTTDIPVVGVLHSYSGGADLVAVYAGLGMAFSFAGPVTYANARKPLEAARAVPAHLLLAETDAPDQTPEGHRGGRSEPAFVGAVIAGLASARGANFDEIAALTTANARRLFRWE